MRKITTTVVETGAERNVEETVYTIEELRSWIIQKAPYWEIVQKREGKRKKGYYNISASFDIETTNIASYRNDGTIDAEHTYAFCYQWQFCLKDHVVFGRTWEEFRQLHDMLTEVLETGSYLRLVIFVHNLGFEFQYIKDFIGEDNIETLFARKKRKPLYFRERCGIEWRCSWMLSNMSLGKFCENSSLCTHYKLSGDLYNYRKLRTPETPLTELEEGYCYNDVRGLCECIDTLLLEDTIATLPLTSTGFVRRKVRQAMKPYRKMIADQALTYEQYLTARKTFRGADTHANRHHTGKIVEDVYSVDEASAYIGVLFMDYFPMSRFFEAESSELHQYEYYLNKYCCMMTIVLADICVKPDVAMPYIDYAHVENPVDELCDNGRIMSAQWLRLNITEIDWEIIKEQYWFDVVRVEGLYYAQRGSMCKGVLETCMEFYKGKTMLRDIPEKNYEYMKSKNLLNAIFGMMVTDIISDEVVYDCHEWKSRKIEREEGERRLEKHYKKAFISYQWGIWITAHARRRLNLLSPELGNDLIYQDTDSKKFKNKKHLKAVEAFNMEIKKRAEETGAYCDYNGKRYYLGIWDDDGHYERFRTWGSKKYAYEKNGELHTTVSGMSKSKGPEVIGSLEGFELGKSWADCGRTVSVFGEEYPHTITVDGCIFTTASYCAVIDTTYTLGITDTYYDIIKNNIETF